MVFMPPGSAKSTYANMYFAPWYLGYKPKDNLIMASYGQELADKFGRRSRNIVISAEYQRLMGNSLSDDSQAMSRWELVTGGSYYGVGVGGPITGQRGDLAIIDDPVKGRDEAESELIRQRTQEWYRDDLWTRLKPGAAVVLIMTRWHEEDLAGWLLEEAENGGEQWEILSLPMVSEENDPLGRNPGERLWGDWFTDEMVIEARRDARRWSALYQQRPAPEEGDYFKADWFKSYETLPSRQTLQVYGASDYAVTEGGGDWTVHVVVGIDPNDNLYVLDLWRGQTASDEWIESFCDLVEQWKPLGWAEETGQIRSGVGPFLTRRMVERKAWTARERFPTRGDKAIRAQSIRGRMAMKGLYLPTGAPWVAELRRECLTFPAGKHDDQVDALGLLGQLLDKMVSGKRPKAKDKTRWDYRAAKDSLMVSEVPIRELIERKARRRAADNDG
tara:strand:- start:3915 stop:5252 length:1338 start_codon:yes stop_codon:yes gene_type:complete